jgi:hypothetical protein
MRGPPPFGILSLPQAKEKKHNYKYTNGGH